MPWLTALALRAATVPSGAIGHVNLRLLAEGSGATDVVTAAVQQVLGYGILGLAVLVLGWVFYKGTFTRTATAEANLVQARAAWDAECKRMTDAHAAEISRLTAALDKAETQRDAAMTLVTSQLFPLVSAFTSSTNSLLPVLQQLLARGGISSGRTDQTA